MMKTNLHYFIEVCIRSRWQNKFFGLETFSHSICSIILKMCVLPKKQMGRKSNKEATAKKMKWQE